jgi:transcriptional regulator with XRE-family HTH domain
MPNGADFGLAIWIVLMLRGMSQTDLARAAHLSDKTLSSWNSSSRNPDPKSLEKVAGALGIPLAELRAMAAQVAGLRARLGPPVPTSPQPVRPQHASWIAELSPSLHYLSDADLTFELGRARELQLAVESEILARKRVG